MWIEQVKWPEVAPTESTILDNEHNTLSHIATKLGIRESYLSNIPNLGSLQIGDIFTLTRVSDGGGILNKIRTKVEPGQNKINEKYPLSKEAIYQNIEKWPEAFPYITFARLPATDEYQLMWLFWEALNWSPLKVSTANLDDLKKAIAKISWVFITECGARNALSDLSCSIKPEWTYAHSIRLNSGKWWDFIPSSVSLEWIQKLLKWKPTPAQIAENLAWAQKEYLSASR